MQCVQINKEDLKRTEQVIFNFLWGTKNINDTRARDRIKRSIMKNEYNEGGLKITDIECLDKSLKLRQYIKACSSNHAIKAIQAYCTKNVGIDKVLAQEFHIATSEEDVCKIAQETINLITDHTREEVFGEQNEDEITSSVAITQISMTNIETYLKRKGRVFLNCIQARFGQEGLETYLDIVSEAETEIDRNRKKRLESIICAFPKYFRDAANNFNENINIRNETLTHFLRSDKTWIPANDVTTKDLQWILKNALNRIAKADFEQKTGIRNDIINPLELRKVCKNPKSRNIYFRMIHNDFFTYERMFKYKMSTNPNCPRCNQVETSKHLLWECADSKKMWSSYNDILKQSNYENMIISCYEDLYRIEGVPLLMTIKLKLIQELIQIVRPTNWCKNRTINLILQLRNIEMHSMNPDNIKIMRRWENFKLAQDLQ
jgi:hypothetical protein